MFTGQLLVGHKFAPVTEAFRTMAGNIKGRIKLMSSFSKSLNMFTFSCCNRPFLFA